MTPGQGLRQTPRKVTPETPASGPRVPGTAPDVQPEVARRDGQARPSGPVYRRPLNRLGRQRPGLRVAGSGTHQARWASLSHGQLPSASSGPQHAGPLGGPQLSFPVMPTDLRGLPVPLPLGPGQGGGCEMGLLGPGGGAGVDRMLGSTGLRQPPLWALFSGAQEAWPCGPCWKDSE